MNRTLEYSIGGVVIAFAAFMFYESFNPLYAGFGQPEFPPMRFPRWILMAMAGLGALHVVRTAMGLATTEKTFADTIWLRTALVAVSALAGAILIKPIGFTLASMATFWAVGWFLGYRKILYLTVIAVLFALGTWALFTFAIKLGLPTSPFFNRI